MDETEIMATVVESHNNLCIIYVTTRKLSVNISRYASTFIIKSNKSNRETRLNYIFFYKQCHN